MNEEAGVDVLSGVADDLNCLLLFSREPRTLCLDGPTELAIASFSAMSPMLAATSKQKKVQGADMCKWVQSKECAAHEKMGGCEPLQHFWGNHGPTKTAIVEMTTTHCHCLVTGSKFIWSRNKSAKKRPSSSWSISGIRWTASCCWKNWRIWRSW